MNSVQVVLFHIAEGVAGASPSGKLVVDPLKLAPIARLGGNTYAAMSTLFDIPRPDAQGTYPNQGKYQGSARDKMIT